MAAGDRVALYLDESLEAVVAVCGVLKAGAVYVPFDPSAPVARLAHIVGDCAVRCVVTPFRKLREAKELATQTKGR